jgi:hypothetical protein
VSGAPVDQLEEASAYELLNVNQGWVSDPLRASTLTDELGAITVSDYAGGYVATTLDPFDSRVYVRRMQTATENFARRLFAFSVAPTEAAFPVGGREHPALRESSLEINVSYAVEQDEAPVLHLATFRFHGSELGRPFQPGINGDAG